MQETVTMEKMVALCSTRGFVYPGSQIYGGLANAWDYGPLGVELKNNIKRAWWKKFVQESPHNVGMDAAILMNSRVWEVSGHLGSFTDPLTDCRACRSRFRADKLIADWGTSQGQEINADGWSNDQLTAFIREQGVLCPQCKARDLTDVRNFNMMFKTFQGVTEDSQAVVYLRPETAQGIFVNFRNVLRTTRSKLPLGIAQVGKAFRNEITPGNFVFRTREFEQMELEFFCKPAESEEWFDYWCQFCRDWLRELGLSEERVRMREHSPEELSHYSRATSDIEYRFPFGWAELWGIADRTDYDLRKHAEASGEDFTYLDPYTNERFIPYCVEPSVGVERLFLAFLTSAYCEEELEGGDSRVVLRLHPMLAPYKAAVLPLSRKLSEQAQEVHAMLRKHFAVDYDETASIGKRYRRQDEIGTPYCITFDFESLDDDAVTIRDRDSMEQVRLPIPEVTAWLQERLAY
ncbi:MAG: glycine--tRNA ligase [Limnochordia bacterium]